MGFFSNLMGDVKKLNEMEGKLDQLNPGSDEWLIQMLKIQMAQVKAAGSKDEMFIGIYSVYSSMIKEGLDKWQSNDYLINQFEQLFILQNLVPDKRIQQTSMGMCIAIAGLIEGELFYNIHPSVGRINKRCQNAWSKWVKETFKKSKSGALSKRNIDDINNRFLEMVKNVADA